MSSSNDAEVCLICLKTCQMLIPINEVLSEVVQVTIADLLRDLNFVAITDADVDVLKMCFICVGRIQQCHRFKTLCRQSDQIRKNRSKPGWTPDAAATAAIPQAVIKTEDNFETVILKAEMPDFPEENYEPEPQSDMFMESDPLPTDQPFRKMDDHNINL